MNRRAYEAKANIIKALAHPSRLMMVEALLEGEKCVCDLTKLVGSDISTVSKHLAVLREAGIVEDRKVGQWVFYKLRVPCIVNFLGCVEDVMESEVKDKVELTATR